MRSSLSSFGARGCDTLVDGGDDGLTLQTKLYAQWNKMFSEDFKKPTEDRHPPPFSSSNIFLALTT